MTEADLKQSNLSRIAEYVTGERYEVRDFTDLVQLFESQMLEVVVYRDDRPQYLNLVFGLDTNGQPHCLVRRDRNVVFNPEPPRELSEVRTTMHLVQLEIPHAYSHCL